jgi:hypothetical protein
MTEFETLHIKDAPLVIAPDGGEVRVLLALPGGSMATFELEPGRTSIAVTHRTVEEVWFLHGRPGRVLAAAGCE